MDKEALFQAVLDDEDDWRDQVNAAWDNCLDEDDKLRLEIIASESSS